MNLEKGKLRLSDQIEFLSYLVQLLDNGFSLNDAVTIIPRIWEKGNKVSEAIKQFDENQDLKELFYSLGYSKTIQVQVSIAVKQGSLIECLNNLVTLLKMKSAQMKKIKEQMTYPIVIVVMMIGVFIFTKVLLKNEVQDANQNNHVMSYVLSILVIIIICYCILTIRKMINTQNSKLFLQAIKIPVLGKIFLLYAQYTVLFDLSLLVANGNSLHEICSFGMDQDRESLQYHLSNKLQIHLQNGHALDHFINEEKLLPKNLILLLSGGDTHEKISRELRVYTKIIFDQLKNSITKLCTMIQPVSFLLIGVAIFGMYLKILLPIYSMMKGI